MVSFSAGRRRAYIRAMRASGSWRSTRTSAAQIEPLRRFHGQVNDIGDGAPANQPADGQPHAPVDHERKHQHAKRGSNDRDVQEGSRQAEEQDDHQNIATVRRIQASWTRSAMNISIRSSSTAAVRYLPLRTHRLARRPASPCRCYPWEVFGPISGRDALP